MYGSASVSPRPEPGDEREGRIDDNSVSQCLEPELPRRPVLGFRGEKLFTVSPLSIIESLFCLIIGAACSFEAYTVICFF